ncbi:hypothetical protein [Microbacterium jejuense]|uniref:hypothetical protein n=1 Tax=Microbacterium jejuense TaxID=1263637 RepID=UPI0031E5FE69
MGRLLRHRKLKPRHQLYRGRAWEPRDLEALARAIADLALGQWRHVEALLHSTEGWDATGANYAVDGAIQLLTVPPGKDPWHRDGWVFQLISWIAAVEENQGPARMPQMEQASKGFDGLQLVVDRKSGYPSRLIIFEDKATSAPRDMVRDDVWPSFEAVEAGERNPALAAEVGYLLERVSGADVPAAVDRLMRDASRRAYRVSVTVGSHHARAEAFNGLFDGFEEVVPGARSRRHGNVLEVTDLREWMNLLCTRAIELLEEQRV